MLFAKSLCATPYQLGQAGSGHIMPSAKGQDQFAHLVRLQLAFGSRCLGDNFQLSAVSVVQMLQRVDNGGVEDLRQQTPFAVALLNASY